MTRFALALALITAACSTNTTPEPAFEVRVTETDTGVDIVATHADGAELGRISLVTGTFVLEEDRREVDGRQLEVHAAGASMRHESEGYQVLRLPLRPGGEPAFNQMLLDERVRTVLARWDVTFEDVVPPETVPVAAGEQPSHACNPAPSSMCGATSCIQDNVLYDTGPTCDLSLYQFVCCGATKKAVMRRCNLGANNPCGAEGGNGCVVCWMYSYVNSCSTYHITPQNFTCSEGSDVIPWNFDIGITYN